MPDPHDGPQYQGLKLYIQVHINLLKASKMYQLQRAKFKDLRFYNCLHILKTFKFLCVYIYIKREDIKWQ